MPIDSLEDYEWKETEKIWEESYVNMNGDLLYLEDSFDRQTDFDDFAEGDRYQVKVRKSYEPVDEPDEVLHSGMDWDEAESALEEYVEE